MKITFTSSRGAAAKFIYIIYANDMLNRAQETLRNKQHADL